MADALKTIEFFRGDSYAHILEVVDSAGNPVPLSDENFVLTVSQDKIPVDASKQVLQIQGVIHDDPTTGIVNFTPSTTDTDKPPGKYFYDIQITYSNGNVKTLGKGMFIITQDITK